MTLKFCFTHIRHHTICILSSTWAISGHVGDMNSLLWRHQERQSGSESPGSCGLISVLWGQPELRTRVWERSSLSMCELVRNHVKAKRIDGNTHFGGFMAHERESPLRLCVCVGQPPSIPFVWGSRSLSSSPSPRIGHLQLQWKRVIKRARSSHMWVPFSSPACY